MPQLTSLEAVQRIAMLGLSGNDPDPFEVDSLDQLLIRADTQRVAVQLDRAVSAGIIANADDSWRATCRDRAIAAASTTLAAHGAAWHLAEAGIDAVVLKGCATGPIDYADPITRFSSDVDILVTPEELVPTITKLGQRSDIPRSRRWDERFGHAVTVTGPTGVEIDVHVRANHGYVGLSIPTNDLFSHTETFEIGGQTLTSLDAVSRLVIAAMHADGVHHSLHALRDVAQLVLVTGADWEEAAERCRRWQVDTFFARGVVAAWTAAGLVPHPIVEWARNHQPDGRQRLATRFRGPRSQVLVGPLALPMRHWPSYLVPLVAPRRSYVEHGGKSWAERRRIVRSELSRPTDR